MKIILASASPRRKELLEKTGLKFEVDPANIDESRIKCESAKKLVEILAIEKAKEVGKRHPNSIIIGSDTVVAFNDQTLGKPKDKKQAKEILKMLCGKTNHVITSVAVFNTKNNLLKSSIDTASVKMKKYSDSEIDDYIASGEPMDCAGAYKIQGKGAKLIENFSGDKETIIGLPAKIVGKLLSQMSK